MVNSNYIEDENDIILSREIDEFEMFVFVRHSSIVADRGRFPNAGTSTTENFAVWGRIRPLKIYEVEKVSGAVDQGEVAFEYRMNIGTHVPNEGDYLEWSGVQSRQPTMRYKVIQTLPQSSSLSGRCVIKPVGEGVINRVVAGSGS